MNESDPLHPRRHGGRGRSRARPSGRWRKRQGTDDPASLLLDAPGYRRGRQLPRLHGGDRGRARAGGLLHAQARRRHAGRAPPPSAPKAARAWCWSCSSPTSRPRDDRARSGLAVLAAGPTTVERRPRAAFPPAERRRPTVSHPAMAVNLDACIQCNLCVRACREVQVNDVIGMAGRGHHEQDRVRLRRPDGRSAPASPAANACRPARPAR